MRVHEIALSPHPVDQARVMETFRALSDPVRIKLVLLLMRDVRNVGELVEALGLPQSTVSRHLAILRNAKIVATRRDRTTIYYRLADAHVGNLVRQAFAHAEHERLDLQPHGTEAGDVAVPAPAEDQGEIS